jgi:uncharacterized protein YsxB (DUF464 family)
VIRVDIAVDGEGSIRSYVSRGHGGGVRGSDPACAAVSNIGRTLARLMIDRQDVQASGEAPEAGKLYLQLDAGPSTDRAWLRGVSDFVIRSLRDAAVDFPERIAVKIEDSRKGEQDNGS